VRERYPGVDVHRAPAESLPFPDQAFDATLAQLVVHFMKDPVAGLTEMRRVTRRHGVVAACVWDHAGDQGPLSLFWATARQLDPGVEDESDLPGVRQGHLGELFRKAGLNQVEETALPISFHIVGPRNANVAQTFMNPTPGVKETFIAIAPISICEVVSTLVFTGILARHPRLRFVLVECGIGWIPYFVERMDQTFEKHRFWTKSVITEKPSTYWYGQGYATFIRDLAGVESRHRAGLRNIMWSTDYPHSDSTWPKSREALAEHFNGVPPAERALITGGTCAALYGLD